ncbi:MAG: tyrosine--tRNA ligase [Rhodospirillales bacterium]|jgi:tyrosyl-tRNA synthetase|nr:tyrosine--tRNA ligase [Rhodospirillaceae bacterium]MDP6430345.1 tyrosine--tRNA ligase [Rhodospirillales bacterium]MDP6646065.1 tyrosine--tRNA ligase [Rhodospirillales bacterium]MDP6841174.1 tyrosine--tRNA ligase [Rhodospirillales bacterium]|tara:strand:+ start:205 stop:1458 length:1254 start_codon:yes stop_codon:yes gene_type:complete
MPKYKSDFIRTIVERGFLHQCTDLDALDALAGERVVTAYIGFDCTAPSLHAGSLMPIMLLRWMQQTGHRPIVLMGGGTTKVGDPSGKDESRQILTVDQIVANLESIKSIFSRYLTFGDGPSDAIMANNADWLDELQYIPFLREYGRHFTINRMLTFDSVKLRLEREHALTFLEFNYMILQAYDFLELARRYDCDMQMGGSDQWGNIINGVELGRRTDGRTLFGLTSPLLTTASGAKMGKTADGAVWLDQVQLSAYEFWQYWRNTEDADVGRFLRLFTELPIGEIERLEKLKDAEINEAKKILAGEATTLCHGAEAAENAAATAEETFVKGGAGDDLPTVELSEDQLSAGIPAFEIFRLAGLCKSNGEARRLIKGQGARLNDQAVTEETRSVTLADLDENGAIKLSAGKKRHVLLRIG